jgi:hypothetical protein
MSGSPVVACRTPAEVDKLVMPPERGRVIKDLLTTMDGDDEEVAEA